MHNLIRLPWCVGVTLVTCAPLFIVGYASASVPAETRNILQEWVTVKALVSEEREDWAVEKALVTDTIDLLGVEKEMLSEQIKMREEAAKASDDQRTELSLRKEVLEAEASTLGGTLTTYEAALADWISQLPQLLQDELAPLIRRLPVEGESNRNVGIGRRLQAVVGILSQVDKFNSSVTYRKELRGDEGTGSQRETDTLYFGLAYAVYSDADGSSAGYGTPGAEGWVWKSTPEASDDIRELIAVYKNEIPAKYISIPISIN
jgi:hypothetical protein